MITSFIYLINRILRMSLSYFSLEVILFWSEMEEESVLCFEIVFNLLSLLSHKDAI